MKRHNRPEMPFGQTDVTASLTDFLKALAFQDGNQPFAGDCR
jgi:hypothetical protein